MLETIFVLVACHVVGDYVLQNDFIANTKGSSWYHLFVHCVLYAVPFVIVFGWGWKIALIAAAHFPIDALKARYKKITYAQDQILHYFVLACYFV